MKSKNRHLCKGGPFDGESMYYAAKDYTLFFQIGKFKGRYVYDIDNNTFCWQPMDRAPR